MGKQNVVPHPNFDAINLGTKVTVSKMEKVEIDVTLGLDSFVGEFGVALAKELNRRNPQRFEAISSQAIDLGFSDAYSMFSYYVNGIVEIRLELIHKNGRSWQKAKKLAMTPIIQEAISSLGVMKDYSRGLIFEPLQTGFEYDIDTMLKVSEIVEVFQLDGMKIIFDAFPKMETGDDETMSCVIIDQILRARSDEISPSASYISVFLGLKCSATSELRFEVPYDSVPFIHDDLMKDLVKCCF